MVKKVIVFLVIFLFVQNVKAEETEMYTYKSMKTEMLELSKRYGLEVKEFGHSEFGRDLLAIKVGKGKRSILITGSHHGREWLSTHIIMAMIKEYAIAYKQKQTFLGHNLNILDDVSIWFVPMVNPDGVTIQQQGIDHFPFLLQEIFVDMNEGERNFLRWKANALGVDLNRQYPAGWENIKGDTGYASYSHYKGKKPFEAKETRALVDFTEEIQPLTSAAYHTSGRELYWYYYNELSNLQRDHELVDKIAKKTGYEVSYPPFNAIGGGYTDWFIQTYQRPALTIELSYLVKETNPPLSVFLEEWKRNKEVALIMCEFAKEELVEK
ncbi:M14 family metallocarboxypeptidase [Bacillus sp. AFS040349]|uniref:M14 family metallopeptidase n=1 Tax=Bacillus sp. AFS040349 TaxID=2033502 RepID=UPI000BFCA3F0|nr:M14 family metallocarboxypeptidase [Bacillus sp. AFS040349]PGT80733.1 carboxypeptidase [Bacillus sp. AFS040349]